jgi:hypothetical protein
MEPLASKLPNVSRLILLNDRRNCRRRRSRLSAEYESLIE